MNVSKLLYSFLCFIFCLCASESHACDWHKISQRERNIYILQEAEKDLEKNVGKNCKNWCIDIVSRASEGQSNLPLTTENGLGYIWRPSSDVRKETIPIEKIYAGMIIQMNNKVGTVWTPHTVIVRGVGVNGFTVIESNVVAVNVVGIRYITFKQFRKKTEGHFTIYSVL